MFVSLDEIRSGSGQSFWDLIVIGSGPVGLTLAREIAGCSIRTLVVESGSYEPDAGLDGLDAFENVGAPRIVEPHRLRARRFGGTSSIWSGRCAPLDAIDFESRPWVPNSGWPIDAADISARYAGRAAAHLGLAPETYDERLWTSLRRKRPAIVADRLSSQFWQYSRDWRHPLGFMHFGLKRLPRRCRNVGVLLGATVTRIDCGPEGREFAAVDVAACDGLRVRIAARAAVVCAGGIENARLLLASRPLGRSMSDAVGRFLMDHPRCTIGHFDVRQIRSVAATFGLYRSGKFARSRWFTHGVVPSRLVQREERLLNCAAWVTEWRDDDDPWELAKRLVTRRRGSPQDLCALARNTPLLMEGLWRYAAQRRGILHKCHSISLDCTVEQVPDPDSRVTLSDRCDRFGMPLARIDWRVGALERTTVARFAHLVAGELERCGGPRLDLVPWIRSRDHAAAELMDAAHPMGTTRMSRSSVFGVVDPDLRVHGVAGLYVAGTSVFPTAGHANPTLMAVLLAVRLADHLKTSYRQS